VGSQSADTTKFCFRKHFGAVRQEFSAQESRHLTVLWARLEAGFVVRRKALAASGAERCDRRSSSRRIR
jgi:hypothetical protein